MEKCTSKIGPTAATQFWSYRLLHAQATCLLVCKLTCLTNVAVAAAV